MSLRGLSIGARWGRLSGFAEPTEHASVLRRVRVSMYLGRPELLYVRRYVHM